MSVISFTQAALGQIQKRSGFDGSYCGAAASALFGLVGVPELIFCVPSWPMYLFTVV